VIELGANHPADLIRAGLSFAGLGRRAEAHAIATRVSAVPLPSASLNDALGSLFTYCEDAARGHESARRAVNLAPEEAAFRYNLAMIERMIGELAEAEQNLDRVLTQRPWDGAAQLVRSGLRRQTAACNHIDSLLSMLGRGRDRAGEVALRYALAKELDDLGEYRQSFSYLRAGADLLRSSMAYDVSGDVQTLEALVATHGASASQEPGFGSDEPIFIIGLPRTGTTLLERILGGHPEIQTRGELPDFPRLVIEGVQRTVKRPVDKMEFAHRSLELSPRKLGQAYIEATRPFTGRTLRFTDKLPTNYLYAWLIRCALPGARIVAVDRQPMDACFAMYRTLFSGAYPFSYDMRDLGRYYLAWRRLMDHWQQVVGDDSWITVGYEALVTSPEPTVRALLEHCRLDWDAECLRVEARATPVATESTVQVRRPISTSSVGAWRRYADELAPLAEFLESNGITVGG
jgi:tetratricopeptide (TPR) repeat protein